VGGGSGGGSGGATEGQLNHPLRGPSVTVALASWGLYGIGAAGWVLDGERTIAGS
jgi:hypothetical protein